MEPTKKAKGLFLLLGLPLLPSIHQAQQPIKSYDWYLDWVYWDMDFVGDLDGDGFGEILLGEGGTDDQLHVVSSSTGLELFTFPGSSTIDGSVRVSALGDTNGDSVEDFGAWFENLGKCLVWSGKDKALLLEVAVPVATVADIGDVNGDTLADVLIGEVGWIFGPGSATVYLGGSFSPAYTVHDLSTLGGGFSRTAAGLGDVDSDGLDDFAVGAPSDSTPGECVPGYVEVFSGVDGTSLYQMVGETVTDNFGNVVSLGDVTGDGIRDMVIGAGSADGLPWCKVGGLGRIYFHDGADGTLLEMLEPEYPKTGLGGLLEAVGDLDGNGFPDVLARVGDKLDPNGVEIWALDGKTRERIYTITSPYDVFSYAFSSPLAGTGDWDGDGFPDYLIGSPNVTFEGFAGAPGKIDLYSGAPIGVASFGAPCPLASGSLPRIGATGSPVIGTDYAMHLSQVEPGLDVFLAIGVSSTSWLGIPLPLDLALVGMPACQLLISLSKVFPAQTVEVTPGLGAATFSLRIPDQPTLIGLTAFAQGFIANPPGSPTLGATTRGLALTFQ